MTAIVKTDVSIQKTLFDQAEILAQQLNISRSHLFGIAIENFIKKHQHRALLDEINKTCEDHPEPDDQILLARMKGHHRKLVEGEW